MFQSRMTRWWYRPLCRLLGRILTDPRWEIMSRNRPSYSVGIMHNDPDVPSILVVFPIHLIYLFPIFVHVDITATVLLFSPEPAPQPGELISSILACPKTLHI